MPSYKQMIEWIAENDDTDFLDDPNETMSIAGSMVSNLCNVSFEKIREDLIKYLSKPPYELTKEQRLFVRQNTKRLFGK